MGIPTSVHWLCHHHPQLPLRHPQFTELLFKIHWPHLIVLIFSHKESILITDKWNAQDLIPCHWAKDIRVFIQQMFTKSLLYPSLCAKMRDGPLFHRSDETTHKKRKLLKNENNSQSVKHLFQENIFFWNEHKETTWWQREHFFSNYPCIDTIWRGEIQFNQPQI